MTELTTKPNPFSAQIRRFLVALSQADWWPGLAVIVLLALFYASTLQTDVNGSSHDYMIDVGEIQVALNVGGTVHYTGYPTFTILSTILTQIGRFLGLGPGTAVSATATFWSLLALLVIYRIFWRLTQDSLLSAVGILALGVMETVWIHGVVAEVYSFSLLCISLALLLALHLLDRWAMGQWLGLAFVFGTAIAHHRLLLLFAPSLFLLVIHSLWAQPTRWRIILYGLLAFLAAFLSYLYLPIRAWQGGSWVYGQPGHWAGFWQQFSGSEVTGGLLRAPQNGAEWLENGRFLWTHLTHQLPAVLVIAGLAGLVLLTRRQWQVGLAFWWGLLATCAFVWLFPPAVWASAALLPALMLLMAGLVVVFTAVSKHWANGRWLLAGSLCLLAFALYHANRPFLESLTQDPNGRKVIELLQALPTNEAVTVALPWGGSYFAAVYGRTVSHELPPSLTLVDHRANFREIMAQEGKLLTAVFTASFWPPDWWQTQTDAAHFNLAAPGIVVINAQPPYQHIPENTAFDVGNGIHIRAVEMAKLDEEQIILTVYWEAIEPISQNYSVAVHLVAQDPPQGPQDILAQADATHPVSGYSPTSQWPSGEIIRDVYVLPVPAGSTPKAIRLTMYSQDENGQFVNNNWLTLALP